jgi:phytoene desaturase
MSVTRQKVVIIGAGIGGLATANLLAKAGYEVHVYEKNGQPGGRADQFKAGGFTFDMGPSWYLMPEVFEHFYDLLDHDINKQLSLSRLDPAYKVFFEGDVDPITITSDLPKDVATFESIEPGAGESLKKYVARGADIYHLSLKHFLYSNFERVGDFIKKDIVSRGVTMSRLAFTPIDTYVSRFVNDQRLKQILEYPMVFLGTSPFAAPAIYSLMSALDFKEGVFYPQGGLYTIIQSLARIGKTLGVSYHYNSPIMHINTALGVATGITLQGDAVVTADIVISNADLHFTETKLLDEADQTYPEKYWANKQAGPSALLMYLGVKGSLPQLEHHSLLFVDAWKENFASIYDTSTLPSPASIYICKPSGIDTSVAPKNHENVFVLVPLPPGKAIARDDLSDIADGYIAQIAKQAHIPDLKERIVYTRLFGPNDFAEKLHSWQNTALGPSHVLKQSALFRTPNISKKVKGLYYVGGSTVPGIGLPMCLIGAELVYKRLSGEKKGGHVTSIDPELGIKK